MGCFSPHANFNCPYLKIGPCDLFPVSLERVTLMAFEKEHTLHSTTELSRWIYSSLLPVLSLNVMFYKDYVDKVYHPSSMSQISLNKNTLFIQLHNCRGGYSPVYLFHPSLFICYQDYMDKVNHPSSVWWSKVCYPTKYGTLYAAFILACCLSLCERCL